MKNKLTKTCLRCDKVLTYKRQSDFERASHCWNCRNALGIRYTKKKYTKICIGCNKSFLILFHQQKTRKYCSSVCYLKAKGKPDISRICLECGKIFKIISASKRDQKICSQSCQIKWLHANRKGFHPKGRYESKCRDCDNVIVCEYYCHSRTRKTCGKCPKKVREIKPKTERDVWTPKQERLLRKHYSNFLFRSDILSIIPDKTLWVIHSKAKKLGLKRNPKAVAAAIKAGGAKNKGRPRPDLAKRNKIDRKLGRLNPFYGKTHTKKTRKIISDSQKTKSAFFKLNNDPEFIKKRLKGLCERPNKPETAMLEILESMFPGEYSYVGNGDFVLGRLCPDFVNVNGQKKIIEVFGELYHDPKVSITPVPDNRTEKGRKRIFKKYGYDTLVIWTKEIVPNKLSRLQNKIRKFHENSSH